MRTNNHTDIRPDINEFLQERLSAQGYSTSADLANKANISFATATHIFRGNTKNISLRVAYSLSKVLNFKLDDLVMK